MPKEIRIPIYSLNYWACEKYVGGPRFWRLGPPKGLYNIPSLLTDFKISNFVTFSYSGSMSDNENTEGYFLPPYKIRKKSVFRPSKKNCKQVWSSSAHSSSWHLFLFLRGILESLIEPFSRKHHTCTDLIFPLSMGVLARNYEKIYFRENIYVFFAAFRQF